MRPRLKAAENRHDAARPVRARGAASMRPRLKAAENVLLVERRDAMENELQ